MSDSMISKGHELLSDQDYRTSVALWRIVWGRRWLVCVVTVCSIVLSVVAAFVITPVYRVQVVLIPANDSFASGALRAMGSLGGLASLAGIDFGGADDQTVESIALLRSRQFAVDFIRDKDLLSVLFPKKWDAERGQWKVRGDRVPTESDAYDFFDRHVRSVSQDKRTGLVTLAIEWSDPAVAASWATELVNRLNEFMRARAIAESQASIEQLQHELKTTDMVNLQQSLAKLIEAQVQRRTLARVRTEFAFRVVDPAAIPDSKDFVYPRRALLTVLGLLGGLMLSIALALVLEATLGRRRERAEQ